jgi:phage major head subunit gpT-like protein
MKHPKYRASQWIDTSDDAMAQAQATIVYGVQTQRHVGGPWMHVSHGNEPMFFDSLDKASEACAWLRKEAQEKP